MGTELAVCIIFLTKSIAGEQRRRFGRNLMHKHLSQAAIDIDILRNESPVYAVYRSRTLAWIQTGSEPIGEGELVG